MQDRIPNQILNDHCWRRATFRSTGQPWERPQLGQEAEQGRELGQTFVHWVPMFFAAIAVSFYIPRYCFQQEQEHNLFRYLRNRQKCAKSATESHPIAKFMEKHMLF